MSEPMQGKREWQAPKLTSLGNAQQVSEADAKANNDSGGGSS